MQAPDDLKRLVDRFDAHHSEYRSPGYNEMQLRREFLDPLFSLLGWDIDNHQGFAEPYKEVIHEDAIKVGGSTKAPDYCFRIGGIRKFFLEAKKPAVDLANNPEPAFQLRRYAWSAKLSLSILSDFEEFSVYDCRIQPSKTDKAAAARIQLLSYADYIGKWEEIWSTFSKQAILQGAFDKFAEKAKGKKGTAEVDDAFLDEIESWRDQLARMIALRNPTLTQRELNYAVQRTIDRIIFLRICEDRSIEPYGQLQALLNGERAYKRLTELFYRADEKYNSGLFHFSPEKNRLEMPDELSLNLQVDDKVLRDIIGRLYPPDSPYAFSVLPADILGQVYEQFLGKVIRLTEGHRAKVEDKPEVKKAGGVYYTPTYIVEYIVKNTVGKLLASDGMTPKEASKLRILDPACGSGSFLIVAYQMLLDWHRDWYLKDGPEKHATGKNPAVYQAMGSEWRLTTAERKRILLNNIYGVDIDAQAVEVTKLSLLLKVLEGESEQSINQQLKMFHERALPDLGDNIKCGNSLIGKEFYDGEQLGLLADEERFRINIFEWRENFPKVFQQGGFHVIMGNPPYIRIQALQEWAPLEVEFYKQHYRAASSGNYDIYVVFIERALSLLRSAGLAGFILPHKFFNAQYGENLRGLLADGQHVRSIVHFGDQQVFPGVSTYTCLLFISQASNGYCNVEKVSNLPEWKLTGASIRSEISASRLAVAEWNLTSGADAALLDKLRKNSTTLEAVTDRIFQGIKTSADKIYIVEEQARSGKRVKVYSPEKCGSFWLETDLLHPLIKGGDSRRYAMTRTNRLILFPYVEDDQGKTSLVSENDLQSKYPLTYEYLCQNKTYLENREEGKMKGPKWYGFIYPKALDVMPLPKIFTPDIAQRASFSLDPEGEVFFTGGVSGGYGVLVAKEYSREYVLGLLNSRLLEWVIRQTASQMRGGYYSFEARFIRSLPLRLMNAADARERTCHENMVSMVDLLLGLHQDLVKARTEQEKSVIQRQIDATDKQIDQLVYELYGLTEEEVKIVEGASQIVGQE